MKTEYKRGKEILADKLLESSAVGDCGQAEALPAVVSISLHNGSKYVSPRWLQPEQAVFPPEEKCFTVKTSTPAAN